MPTYEYRCQQCRRRNAYTVRGFNPPEAPACAHCGSTNQSRIISRVAIMKSEEARLDALSDPSGFGDLDENDPKSMARMMRKMGSEMGEDLPPEYNEMMDRLEAGESPDSIEQNMGESLGGPDDGGLGDEL